MSENSAQPFLTIGMATHNDFDGVYFTIQSLRLYHSHLMNQIEIVIVNNSPDAHHDGLLRGLVSNLQGEVANVIYLNYTEAVGTSAPRDKVFELATGLYVTCVDCHIMLAAGSVDVLFDYLKEHPDTCDLISGPIMMDNFKGLETHFIDGTGHPLSRLRSTCKAVAHVYENVWRAEMWGIWGTVWQCNCDREHGVRFTIESGPSGECVYHTVDMGRHLLIGCDHCKTSFPIPNIPYHGHESVLESLDYHILGSMVDDVPFEIPGQGLGLFVCRREAWLHFNPHARGFGGEELYIHEKFRKAGHKCVCLPLLLWPHRFGRGVPQSYPVTRWMKVRNYVVEFDELERPLDEVYQHFCIDIPADHRMLESEWEALIKDPINQVERATSSCGGCNAPPVIDLSFSTPDEVFDKNKEEERDLNLHMPYLRQLATGLDTVTEISVRKETTIAFLAARPKKFYSYCTEQRNGYVATMTHLLSQEEGSGEPFWDFTPEADTRAISSIEETDLLFIDSEQTYTRLREELRKYAPSCRRYIAIHDTEVYGKEGVDGKPGLQFAIQWFCRTFPEWSVVYYTPLQYGLTVLSKNPADKPTPPPLLSWKSVKKFVTAHAKHKLSGGKDAPLPLYEGRLNQCAVCPQRVDDRCAVCGCFVAEKAEMLTEDCPLALWPPITDPTQQTLAVLDSMYLSAVHTQSDINEHCPVLRTLASECETVTEFGMRSGNSTTALLRGQPKKLTTYDINFNDIADTLKAVQCETDFTFIQGSTLEVEIEETDFLFIDTLHNGSQLRQELARHSEKVKKFIAFHDTVSFGLVGETEEEGLRPAIREFLQTNPEWILADHFDNNNGLTIIARKEEIGENPEVAHIDF